MKDIYCDLGFWRSLSGRFSNVKMTTNRDELRKNQNLMDWYDLLSRSKLLFDCTVDDFEVIAKTDPYLKDIWKKSIEDDRCQLDFLQGAIASMCAGSSGMNLKMYNSLYLSDKNHEPQARNVGVINVNSGSLHEHMELFNDLGPSIKRGSQYDWMGLLNTAKAGQNCNSMVIADNYIFQDVNANLYRILDALLPHKLKTFFYLTVFSLNKDSESDRKKQLEERIKVIRPELSINVEVFNCTKDEFHDRGIITNYIWIEIGAGFNVLKKSGIARKGTNIHITYPMIISEDRMNCNIDGYWNIIEDAKSCLKRRNERSNNRLLR